MKQGLTGKTISTGGWSVEQAEAEGRLDVGDVVTFDGIYRRRTFWQWLTRQPREIQPYTITDCVSSDTVQQTVSISPSIH